MYSHPLLNPAEEGELHLRNHRAFSHLGIDLHSSLSLACHSRQPVIQSLFIQQLYLWRPVKTKQSRNWQSSLPFIEHLLCSNINEGINHLLCARIVSKYFMYILSVCMFIYISSFYRHKQPCFIDEETEAETLNYMPKTYLVIKCWGQDLNSGHLIPDPISFLTLSLPRCSCVDGKLRVREAKSCK